MNLLDTHAFIWLASDPDQLSKTVIQHLQESRETLGLSVVTAWEIALLCKRGRLELPLPVHEFIQRALLRHRILECPLTRETILHSVALPDIHQDPFDRILIAEAHRQRAVLISKDPVIAQYPETTVLW